MQPVRAISQVSEAELNSLRGTLARQISRERKADAMLNYVLLDRIPSTREEMEADWRNAAIQIALDIMSGMPPLSDLSPECFPHLEEIWADELKEFIAFFNWIALREQVYWSPEEMRKRHYHDGCNKLRGWLSDRQVKDRLENFASIKKYIADEYLDEYQHFDPELARPLIDRKAARLSARINRESGGETYANEFSRKYYGNIIPAIENSDQDACLAVLQSLQHGGSFAGAPGIANAFEVAVAIAFLDATQVQNLWKTGQNVSRDTTF
jgi:hypothetical protein